MMNLMDLHWMKSRNMKRNYVIYKKRKIKFLCLDLMSLQLVQIYRRVQD